jgi:hypothetical protein
MIQAGIGRREVGAVIHHMVGQCPTHEQLATLMGNDKVEPLAAETARLIANVVENGGECRAFEVGVNERAAVLTITAFEKENLRRFGDVIFLDGTMIRNSLGWTTLPITLLNESKEITSGGLSFTAFETQEIFDWFLAVLVDILQDKFCTLVTDEDSALVISAANLGSAHPAIAHRLCTFHKRRNFYQKVQTASRDPEVHAEAMRLFQKIIYSKRRLVVDQALTQLKVMFPALVDYIMTEVERLLPQLSEAYREKAFTLGSSTTSPAESCHRMLKSGPFVSDFVGIRNAHTRNHEMKAAASQVRISRRFRKPNLLQSRFDLELSPAIQNVIDNSISKSSKWQVTSAINMPGYYVARCEQSIWQLRYDGTSIPECECNETSGTGLPCCHMIALFRHGGGEECFPVQAIATRWFIKSPAIVLPPLPQLNLEDHDEIQHLLAEVSSEDEQVEADGDDIGQRADEQLHGFFASDNDDGPGESMESPRMSQDSQQRRYSRMLSVGKEIARKAALNEAQYEDVLNQLQTILESLTIVVDGEIHDVAGHPRGRPRKRGYSRPDRQPRLHCPLCESDSHNLLECRYYEIFRQEQASFAPPGGGKRHCGLCHHPGHRRETCPVLDIARRRVREEPQDPTGRRK